MTRTLFVFLKKNEVICL